MGESEMECIRELQGMVSDLGTRMSKLEGLKGSMTPINLEDVENYLVKRLMKEGMCVGSPILSNKISTIFAELRAREAAIKESEHVQG